ncbi:hypothetical protein [Cupriavidus basilensis]|uniref:hypothetical protein n=1 Tax=Cupriavidus basilensis TaxID=68895 RepID=UPI000A5B8BF8|nr:hypothetical protein [Cupriavidus basilensis]
MIRRLAALIWWCGTIFAAIAAWEWASQMEQWQKCDAIETKYQEIAKNSSSKPVSSNDEDVFERVTATAKLEEAKHQLDICQSMNLRSSAAAILWCLPFYAVAFVLGGSFWRPPRPK